MGGVKTLAVIGFIVAVSFIAVAKLDLVDDPLQLFPFHQWSGLGAGISSLIFSLAARLSVIDPQTTLSETLKITSQSIVWSFTIISFVWAGRIAMEHWKSCSVLHGKSKVQQSKMSKLEELSVGRGLW